MPIQDLYQALEQFKKGAQELAIGNAISDANQAVQQIKGSQMKEEEKRSALQDLSNRMVMGLAGIGAPAATVEMVYKGMAPRTYGSLAEAMQGNDKFAIDAFQKTQQMADVSEAKKARTKHGYDLELIDRKGQWDLMQQLGKGKSDLKQGDLEFNTNVSVALSEAQKLEKLIQKSGNWESSIPGVGDPAAKAQLESAAYQLAINYAKIVDPASVAREGEVAAAQKYLIPLGFFTRNSVSLESVKEYRKKIGEYVRARNSARSGPVGAAQSAGPAKSGGGLDLKGYLE